MFELVVISVVSSYFTVLLLGFFVHTFLTGNPKVKMHNTEQGVFVPKRVKV